MRSRTNLVTDWSEFPNFGESEFRCRHTGRCEMDREFMRRLQALRTEYGKPLFITSGYRHTSHPVESRKGRPGAHTFGRAADIQASHEDALTILEMGFHYGFTGFGIQQKGSGRFIHLDDMPGAVGRPRPTIWSY